MRLPAAFVALREKNLARYVAAAAVSSLGSGTAEIALAFAILDLGGPTDLGLVFSRVSFPSSSSCSSVESGPTGSRGRRSPSVRALGAYPRPEP